MNENRQHDCFFSEILEELRDRYSNQIFVDNKELFTLNENRGELRNIL
jgi:hypothetical protein